MRSFSATFKNIYGCEIVPQQSLITVYQAKVCHKGNHKFTEEYGIFNEKGIFLYYFKFQKLEIEKHLHCNNLKVILIGTLFQKSY